MKGLLLGGFPRVSYYPSSCEYRPFARSGEKPVLFQGALMSDRTISKFTANRDKSVPFRREDLHGRTHLVVPMIMLTEGVHAGSGGPLLYEKKDIANSTNLWDHKPVVVYHPIKKDGTPKTACDPNVLNTSSVGIILNTKEEGGKLKAEAWLDEEKTKLVDNRIIESIEKGEMTEISTGLYTAEESTKGIWNGESYKGIARQYQPDHLAILPDQTGACSIKDGAGLLRVNQQTEGSTTPCLEKTILNAGLGLQMVANVLSFDNTTRQLSDLLSSAYGEKGKSWYGYVVSVFPDSVIFENGGHYYKTDYSVSNDIVSLKGQAVKVQRVVEYKPVRNLTGNSTMAFIKAEHIAALIANGVYTEAERTELEKLPENILSGIKVPEKTVTANTTPTLTVNKETTPVVQPAPTKISEEAWWASAPPGLKEQFLANQQYAESQKQMLINRITGNPHNTFTEEFLKTKGLPELQGLAQLAGGGEVPSAQVPMFYAGGTGGATMTANRQHQTPTPLKTPKLEFNGK